MKSVKVSVLIPVYNAELYIGRCIRSLLNQTLNVDDYELIVIDDGSTDNTESVIKSYIGDLRYYKNKKNSGLPSALNLGIKKSRGQFVVRVDSDDWVHPEYLNTLSLALKLNNHLDAVACDYYLVNNNQEILEYKNCKKDPIGCGVMFKIQQLISLGLYDKNFLIKEDEDLIIRFNKKYNVTRIPIPLYKYRKHEKNMTNDDSQVLKYSKKIKKKHKKHKKHK